MIQQKLTSKTTSKGAYKPLSARCRRKRSVRRGQALVEMALVTIILLFLTLGLIQYGLIANAKVTLTNIAREGARFAAINGLKADADNDTSACAGTPGSIKCRIKDVRANSTLSDMNVNTGVTITPALASRTKGQLVTVTVSYNLRNKLILPSGFPGLSNFGTTQVSASMVLE